MELMAKLRGIFSEASVVAEGRGAGLKLVARGADPNFARGIYEQPMQEAVISNLSAGDVFFDVGANIGFFSLIAARRVGPEGHVYAFEPVPRNAAASLSSSPVQARSRLPSQWKSLKNSARLLSNLSARMAERSKGWWAQSTSKTGMSRLCSICPVC